MEIGKGIQMDVPEENGDDHILDAMKYVIVALQKYLD
jgi:hypothetical protein